ncbi:hypothetical protein [Denitromonas halophila]|uniref:DUF4304 domain-containing protein n=1 Tax=Denitromonas halophila TaxID=1629404 RepID=A0A557QIC6_9RHOO|nr:hypothetical protein [Denitromonas halophila]TVO52660.1 hypothetical protein FHP91_17140 [Denitromonas halophila]
MTFISTRKLEKAIDRALQDWLSPYGFRPANGGGVERWQDNRYDFIGSLVCKIGGENRITPFGQMGFREHENIYSHFIHPDRQESEKLAIDATFKYAHFVKDWTAAMRCQQVEELEGFLGNLRGFVMERLFPTLMSYDTPHKILALYIRTNEKDPTSFAPPTWHGYSSALTALILARLYESSHYKSLKHRYSGEFEGLDEEKMKRVQRLLEYLDLPDPLPALE